MSTTPNPGSPHELTEEERAAAFAKAFATTSEGGAPRIGQSPIPPKFVLLVAAAFVVLGLGGVVLEHFYGNVGQPSSSTTTIATLPPSPNLPQGPQISASTQALMGLKSIATASAPGFTLTDQTNHSWSLADAAGKVVVLTFYNQNCLDICSVLGPEIRQADASLGSAASRVEFVIVNTDPTHFTYRASPAALVTPGLANVPNVRFLTGPLNMLNSVWINYGLTVHVGALPNEIAHNNVMYFITPRGALSSLAVPFGNENFASVFSLDSATIHRFAEGIAQTAIRLAR